MTPVHQDDDGTYADVSAFAADTPDAPPSDTDAGPAAIPPATPGPEASTEGTPATVRGQRRWRRWLGFFLIGALIGGVIAVWRLGDPSTAMPSDHPDISSMTAAPAASPEPLDEALVGELKAKVEANPADAESLRAIAAEYFRVGQFAESATWQAKVVDLDSANVDNRLILGVALYSDNKFTEAEEQWLTAAELDPASPDPWYNLGFLYLSLDPPADDKAEAAWRKVIELAPGSDIANTVASHLDRLDTPVPGASASAPAPAASATPTPTK